MKSFLLAPPSLKSDQKAQCVTVEFCSSLRWARRPRNGEKGKPHFRKKVQGGLFSVKAGECFRPKVRGGTSSRVAREKSFPQFPPPKTRKQGKKGKSVGFTRSRENPYKHRVSEGKQGVKIKWRRGESNPCPSSDLRNLLHAYPVFNLGAKLRTDTPPTPERPRNRFTSRRGHPGWKLACCRRLPE